MKAVVFIDVQNDFISGTLKNENAIKVMPDIISFASECVKARERVRSEYKIYATRDTHEKNMYFSTLEGQKLPIEHCIRDSWGWKIEDRLDRVLMGNCAFIDKPTFGSFKLAEIIKEDDVKATNSHNILMSSADLYKKTVLDEIILCGFCTDICVISNALILRAKFPNVKITIMKDLCAGSSELKHEAALRVAESCQIEVK